MFTLELPWIGYISSSDKPKIILLVVWYLFIYLHLSIYIYLSISIYLYLSIYIVLFILFLISTYFLSIYIYLSISIYLYLSIYIYIYLFISIYIYLFISIYLHLSIYIHPSIHPSIYLSDELYYLYIDIDSHRFPIYIVDPMFISPFSYAFVPPRTVHVDHLFAQRSLRRTLRSRAPPSKRCFMSWREVTVEAIHKEWACNNDCILGISWYILANNDCNNLKIPEVIIDHIPTQDFFPACTMIT